VSATTAPEVGQDFGDYRIDAFLGRGAMGVVYRAWQHRMGRPVALKVLPAEPAQDPVFRYRFAREAAALARLDSPHVIQASCG
jgi:serine/threonine protein kinase